MEIQFCGAHKCYIHPHFSIYTAITNDIVDAKSLSTHKSTIQLQLQFVYDFFAKYCAGFFSTYISFHFHWFSLFHIFSLFLLRFISHLYSFIRIAHRQTEFMQFKYLFRSQFHMREKNYMKNSQLG